MDLLNALTVVLYKLLHRSSQCTNSCVISNVTCTNIFVMLNLHGSSQCTNSCCVLLPGFSLCDLCRACPYHVSICISLPLRRSFKGGWRGGGKGEGKGREGREENRVELAWGTLSSAQVRCQLFMQILSHFTILQSADVRVCSSRHLSASGHDRCPIPLPRPRKTRRASPTFPQRRAKWLSPSSKIFHPCKKHTLKRHTHKNT